MEKRCNLCGDTKPLELFHKDNRAELGRGTTCLVCVSKASARYRKKHYYRLRAEKFGITEGQLLAMYVSQEYRCAGCGIHEEELTKALHIDHCHTTGEVRGLLCNDCNVGLGWLKDDINIMYNLIAYLNGDD